MTSKPNSSPAQRPARWLPGAAFCVYIVILLLGSAALFLFEVTPDHALDHLIGMGLAALIWISILTWFTAFSAYSATLRRSVFVLSVVGVAGFLAVYRPEFTGEMIPYFRARWAPTADQRLTSLEVRERVEFGEPGPNDCPRFFGADGQGGVDGAALARTWDDSPPRLLWRRPIGASWSAFSAVNGLATTLEQRGPEELVVCYDVLTGEPKWSHALEVRHESFIGGVGPRSTPTIADGNVYAVGGTAVLRCLDGGTGALKWSVDLVAEFGSTADEESAIVAWGRANSPLVADGMVIVPAGGRRDRPTALAAFDSQNGDRLWASGEDNVSYSSPIVGELAGVRQVVAVNEKTVAGYRIKDGRQLWTFPWPGNSNADANTSQPSILPGDRVAVSKAYGTGGAVWRIERSGDDWTATELWANPRVLRTKLTSSIHHDEHLYALSDGILQCVDAQTGELKWKGKRFRHGQLLRSHDLLLVLSESGDLSLVDCRPDRFDELGAFPNAVEGKCWNNLCLIDNLLLIRSEVQAACYELPRAPSPENSPDDEAPQAAQ